jgi:hypothetical protein
MDKQEQYKMIRTWAEEKAEKSQRIQITWIQLITLANIIGEEAEIEARRMLESMEKAKKEEEVVHGSKLIDEFLFAIFRKIDEGIIIHICYDLFFTRTILIEKRFIRRDTGKFLAKYC